MKDPSRICANTSMISFHIICPKCGYTETLLPRGDPGKQANRIIRLFKMKCVHMDAQYELEFPSQTPTCLIELMQSMLDLTLEASLTFLSTLPVESSSAIWSKFSAMVEEELKRRRIRKTLTLEGPTPQTPSGTG